MRGLCVSLLVLSCAFTAGSGATASILRQGQTDMATFAADDTELIPTERLLRSLKGAELKGLPNGTEERAGLSTVAEKASSSLTTLKTKFFFLFADTKPVSKLGNEFDRFSYRLIDDMVATRQATGAELASISVWLRGIPNRKNVAESMQRYLALHVPSSRVVLMDAWMKSDDSFEKVFKVLRVEEVGVLNMRTNDAYRQWFAYLEKLGDSVSYKQVLSLLQKQEHATNPKLTALFQSLEKVPELKSVGKKLRTQLFETMILAGTTPKKLDKLLGNVVKHEPMRLSLAKHNHPSAVNTYVEALKAYTLQFAAAKGTDVTRVESLFKDGKLEDALEVAMKGLQ